jgi:hypothetical protein
MVFPVKRSSNGLALGATLRLSQFGARFADPA